MTGYTNDGQVSQDGQCLGQIMIFGGKGYQCKPSGLSTSYYNCCAPSNRGMLDFTRNCQPSDGDTVAKIYSEDCHYIGQYCTLRWKYIGCMQQENVYCCFTSKLARIIQEQGREQLKLFAPDGNWGTPQAPNCIGFSPDQFQSLDFSKIDLSEYFSDITASMSTQTQQNMVNSIGNYYQNTLQH
jgi:hypothetical protein